MQEIFSSLNIIEFCLKYLPGGLSKNEDNKFSFSSRIEMKTSIENMITHFKLFSEGFAGSSKQLYTGIEAPKGELGVFLITNISNKPYRCKIRAPGFFHLQGLEFIIKNQLLADLVTIIGTQDIVFGEVDR